MAKSRKKNPPKNSAQANDQLADTTEALIPEVLSKDDSEIEVIDVLDDLIEEPVEIEPTTTGITRYDPLSLYLQEVKKIPTLSKDEEKNLAIRYVQKNDLEAAKQLVQSNLWLVVKIAREYQNAAKNMLDLIQEGNMGLMEAVKNFDPFRDVRLPSYAMWWIKAYIVRFLIANFRLVKIGTTQAQRKLFFNLKKEKAKLEKAGFFPTPKLLAEKLDVKENEIIEMEQRLSGSDLSVHTPISEDSDGDLLSILPSQNANAEELLAEKEDQELVKKHFSEFATSLNEKELAIFHGRLLSEEKMTLQELSDKFGISKERIRQIEERLMEKLKFFMQEKLEVKIS